MEMTTETKTTTCLETPSESPITRTRGCSEMGGSSTCAHQDTRTHTRNSARFCRRGLPWRACRETAERQLASVKNIIVIIIIIILPSRSRSSRHHARFVFFAACASSSPLLSGRPPSRPLRAFPSLPPCLQPRAAPLPLPRPPLCTPPSPPARPPPASIRLRMHFRQCTCICICLCADVLYICVGTCLCICIPPLHKEVEPRRENTGHCSQMYKYIPPLQKDDEPSSVQREKGRERRAFRA